MNRTTKTNILAYASEPDKNYKYEGDIVDYVYFWSTGSTKQSVCNGGAGQYG